MRVMITVDVPDDSTFADLAQAAGGFAPDIALMWNGEVVGIVIEQRSDHQPPE